VKNLREKITKGIFWSATEKLGVQSISFVVFAVLTRMLDAQEFGLISLATVYIAFLTVFLDQGFRTAIVQKEKLESEHLNTAFWSNVILGLLLTTMGFVFSDLVSALFNEPRISPIINCLSFTILIESFSVVPIGILQRKMDFRNIAKRNLLGKVCGGVIGLIAAFQGYGVWALVIQQITGSFVSGITLWAISDWRPRVTFSKRHFMDLFGFGASLTGTQMLSFVTTRSHDIVIGAVLGTSALGYYAIASRVINFADSILGAVVSNVTISSFSRLQNDREKLKRIFYKATLYMSLVAIPFFLFLVVMAPELIATLFGEKWENCVPLMQILCFGAIIMAIMRFNGNLITSLGKPHWILFMRVCGTVLLVSTYLLVVETGLNSIALARSGLLFVYAPILVVFTDRLVSLDFKIYFGQLIPVIAGAFLMIIIVYLLKYLFIDIVTQLEIVVICGISALLAYYFFIMLIRPAIILDLIEMMSLKRDITTD